MKLRAAYNIIIKTCLRRLTTRSRLIERLFFKVDSFQNNMQFKT